MFASQDVLVPWHVRVGRKDQSAQERLDEAGAVVRSGIAEHGEVDEEKQAAVFQRYCHVYKEGELRSLFEEVGLQMRKAKIGVGETVEGREERGSALRIEDEYWDTGNWCIVAKKLR